MPRLTRSPRRLVETADRSKAARLLAAAAQPVQVPRGMLERVLATPLGRGADSHGAAGWWLVPLCAGAAVVLLFVWRSRFADDVAGLAEVNSTAGEVWVARARPALAR